jgi:hypothetical protein
LTVSPRQSYSSVYRRGGVLLVVCLIAVLLVLVTEFLSISSPERGLLRIDHSRVGDLIMGSLPPMRSRASATLMLQQCFLILIKSLAQPLSSLLIVSLINEF